MKRRSGLWIVLLAVIIGGVWWWLRSGEPGDETAGSGEADASRQEKRARPKAFGKPDREVWTQPKATIRGVVRDVDGNPIAGATVCALTRSDEVPTAVRRRPTCVASGPRGYYDLEDLLGVSYQVSASAPRYQPARYENPEALATRRHVIQLQPGQTKEGIDIVLESGGVVVRGVVKDLAGGPVAGAWVRVETDDWFRGSDFAGTVTNDDGAFEAWSKPGRVSVIAAAEGYTEARESGIAPGQTFEVFLTPASTLVGKVVFAETGEPVPGARVTAQMNDFFTRDVGNTHTEDDGTFRIEGIEPGTYKLEATTPELYGLSEEAVHLGLAESSQPIVVPVHPAFSVEGQVIVAGSDGEPCPSGSVQLHDAEQDLDGWESLEPDGSVVVRALQPGTYRVTARCEGFVSKDEYPEVVIEDASVSGLVWEVDRGLAIRGRVVQTDDTPAVGVRVVARPKASDGDPRGQKTNAFGLETDDDGKFELTGLLPGAYTLGTFSRDLPGPKPDPEVELKRGQDLEGVVIELPATGTIRGTVRDERGEPMGGISVNARADAGGWSGTTTTDEGTFVLEHVMAGAVRVMARGKTWRDRMRAPGQTDDDVLGERVNVTQGQTVEVDLVVESHGGTIRGRVVDADGGPIPDAFVDVQRESDSAAASDGGARRAMSWSSWWRDPILTDVDGNFELDELAEGTYTLRAYRQGGGEGVLEGVETGSDVTVELDTPGSLEGTVVVDGGSAPERFSLRVADEKNGINLRDNFFRTHGKWRVTNVPEGDYTIEVTSGEGTAKTEVQLATGEDKTGIELELAGTVTVTGTLVDLDTGAPVPGMKVSIGTRDGMISFNDSSTKEKKEVSDAQGRFEIERAPVGQGRVAVTTFGWGDGDYGWTVFPVTIPKGVKTHELEPIALVKDRTKDDERRGSLGLKIKQSEPGDEEEDRRQIVAFVRPGGPADKAGIAIGDEIVAVEGHDVRGVNAYRYGDLTAAPPGAKVTLTLADDREAVVVLGRPE